LVSYSVIKGGRENPKDYKAYAGGIDIYLKTRRRVHIKFQLVTLENNSGYDGGNVAITYTTLHDGWNSSVTFISCNFSRGTAAHRGGGIFFEAMLKNRQPLNSPHNQLVLEVTHSVFTENKAKTVGGGMYLQVHENQNLTALAEANFTNCNFTGNIVTRPNSAQGGFAAHVVNFKLPGSVPHHLPQYGITFAECLFQYNGPSVRNPSSLGCGVLYISENGRTILKNVNISHNNCTGLAAAQSTVEIYGNITIHNNTGFNGGGVLLCANSVMFITKGVQMSITNNQAQNYGGGIYAEFECSQAIAPCFYGTETKNKSVFLVNNGAKKAGDAIYGGSIDHCFTASNSVLENGTNRVPFDDLFSVNQSSKSLSVISSDPSQVCFCDSKEFNTSNCTPLYYYPNDVYPGAVIKVHVVIVGQRNGTAPGVVGASFNQNSSAKIYISEFEKSKTIDSVACQELRYSISINDTNIQTIEEYNLSLSVENGYFQTLSPNRYTPAFINFYVKPCPYGFEMSDSKCHCTDALKNMLHGIECYISSQLFTRPGNAEWWMGFDNGSTLIFSQYCPFDYCRQSVKDIYLNDESHECAFKRTGILCGRCSKGLSNVFGSSKCTDCRSYTLWKTLGLTLLFAIVGLILLLLVGLLNLNVAEGAINPVLFYVNVVRINHSLFFDSCKNNSFCVEKFLGVFVAWMNLDLELDTCYYHGMTVIGKTAIQFVFPFYLWILTGLIIYFSRRCALVSRVAGKNSVRLLATIILLSYAKLIRTVIDVMWQSKLFQLSNTHTIFYGSVWKMDGNVPYFGKEYRYLSLFAGLVAVITLPYTFVLLFIKCLKRMSHFRALFWVIKWKPFFDAYTGPYRDKYHFWPGFLLLVRIFLFVAIASNVSKGPILNLTLVCTTASILFLLNQPGVYKTWFLSVIESFTYFNLVLFSIGTAYVLQQNSKDDTAGDYPKEKTVCLCVGSMFLLFCGIVAWNLFHIVGGTDYWGQVKVWLQEKKWPWRKRKTVRPLVLRHSVTDSLSSSSSEDELDPILQNAPPVARYDKLREPLVETN
jgi:predicted outer membrane repeat protein